MRLDADPASSVCIFVSGVERTCQEQGKNDTRPLECFHGFSFLVVCMAGKGDAYALACVLIMECCPWKEYTANCVFQDTGAPRGRRTVSSGGRTFFQCGYAAGGAYRVIHEMHGAKLHKLAYSGVPVNPAY